MDHCMWLVAITLISVWLESDLHVCLCVHAYIVPHLTENKFKNSLFDFGVCLRINTILVKQKVMEFYFKMNF